MGRRFVAFDIETAANVPGPDFDWRSHRPLGITCAAALRSDTDDPIIWHAKKADGTPAPRMSQHECGIIVDSLAKMVKEGYTLLTWNGLGFDFEVLAEEADANDVCRQLVLEHVDMMFHVFCDRGFPVGMEKAAQGLGIRGKPAGVSGLLAPQLWAEGQYQVVMDYVAQDVRIALTIAEKCEMSRRFKWKTQKGTTSSMPLEKGWLSVSDALKLPKPDTSWMTKPLSREHFAQWANAEN